MEKLKILPFTRKCSSTVRVPGSKSISNRALILATLSKAKVTLRGMLQSEDVQLMKEALHSLGVQIEESGQDNELIVTGCGGILPVQKQNIFVEMPVPSHDFSPRFWQFKEMVNFILMERRQCVPPYVRTDQNFRSFGMHFYFFRIPWLFPLHHENPGYQIKRMEG